MSSVEQYDEDLEARKRRTEELKALGFNPSNPAHRVAVKVADRYGLDLLLKELVVIPNKGAYITRDGLLSIAHRSGQLDGIVLEEQGRDDTHWWAIVSVYRKDMRYPFKYPGRNPLKGSNKDFGPEMAIKVAESMALRRAFRVTGIASVDESWDTDEHIVDDEDADVPDMPEGSASGTEDEEPY